ncbi:SMC-Scp complex subunit ScpB [Spiroplasma kunkelii]|uniref:SMC-Scp complex subunit ScpB n=1 Tax=Spiroplasma kunkelii TaxID=47834 RepID=UPI000AFA452A|nr:SMC-Scp complex subunit ScpB [Spiroplasma kunkelii]
MSYFILYSTADKYRLATKQEYYQFYLKLANNKIEACLSQAALETLAIIAYRGPISKPEIEELRGVNSDSVIKKITRTRFNWWSW